MIVRDIDSLKIILALHILNNNTNTTIMNTQTMKNRATATRFVFD